MRLWIWTMAAVSVGLLGGESGTLPAFVPGSTRPIIQLTGEKFQYFVNGKLHMYDTANKTLTNYDLNGADLGVPVTFSDKVLLLFGDSWSYTRKDGKWTWYPAWGKSDSIGYFDKPIDFNSCDCMEKLDRELLAAKDDAQPDYSRAPLLKLFAKPSPTEKQPRFYETQITDLAPGQDLGPYGVPTGAFALNGHCYMFYNVKHQEEHLPNGKKKTLFLNSILARTETTSEHWKQNAPPVFKRLYDVSEHPRAADITKLENDEGGGKFIHVAPVLMEKAALERTSFGASLPHELNGKSVVLMFGSSWHYVRSNQYLAVVAADDIEAGTSKWWYCSAVKDGKPEWSRDEKFAAPLIDKWAKDGPCLGEHSVKWNADLKCFVLSYQDRYVEIKVRFSSTPWGPWSDEQLIFGLFDKEAKFMHHKEKDTITPNPVETYKRNGEKFIAPENSGATYGPYLFDDYTKNADGSVTLYFTMSTWTPYQVFLMKTTVKPAK